MLKILTPYIRFGDENGDVFDTAWSNGNIYGTSSTMKYSSGWNRFKFVFDTVADKYYVYNGGTLASEGEYTNPIPTKVHVILNDSAMAVDNVNVNATGGVYVNEIKLVDKDGNSVIKASEEGVKGSAVIENTSKINAVGYKILTAVYNEGLLSGVKVSDGTVAAQESKTVETELVKADGDCVKIYVWDSETMKPLTNNYAVYASDLVDFTVNVEEGRDAVVLQLTDTQIIDAGQKRTEDRIDSISNAYWATDMIEERCFNYLTETINATNPDLILLTGDLVYGEFDDNGTAFTALVDFMDSFGIPWAPIFGNHENESKKGVDWQCEQLEKAENCLFEQKTLTGNGNYSVGIVQGGVLTREFFMLDSNGCSAMSDESLANGHSRKSAGFGSDQIAWYTEEAQNIKKASSDTKISFAYHIQPYKFYPALAKYGFTNVNVESNPINIDTLSNKADGDFGYVGEGFSPWDEDNTVYDGMKELGVDSIFVGHEHCNSASVVYDGVRFQYGQKSSTYDKANYINSNGDIVPGYSDAGFPLVGGTVMKLADKDGEISDAYIYYCKNE